MTIQSQPVRPQRQVPPSNRHTRKAPPSRLPFWLGFGTSFIILTALSMGFLVMSTGLDRINLADLQNNEAAWTPPEIVPTATVDPDVVSASGVVASTSGRYTVGTTLRNISEFNVFIRQSPGFMSKSDSEDVIGRITPGDTVEIIGGPATADGLLWWQVRQQTGDSRITEGWSAEANNIQLLGPVQ